MAPTPAQRRAAARHAPGDHDVAPVEPEDAIVGRRPLTVGRITETALAMVARDGYEALTMRRLAAELGTGAASLYAHVVNKEDLDELLIGALSARVRLPEPDPARWREQVADVCTQLRTPTSPTRGSPGRRWPRHRRTARRSGWRKACSPSLWPAAPTRRPPPGASTRSCSTSAPTAWRSRRTRRRRSPADAWVVGARGAAGAVRRAAGHVPADEALRGRADLRAGPPALRLHPAAPARRAGRGLSLVLAVRPARAARAGRGRRG